MSAAESSLGPPTPEALVLVVGHAPEELAKVEALLAELGVRVLEAAGSQEALELLRLHDVALAIVDAEIPGMNAFDLAAAMRDAIRSRAVPIIFLGAAPPAHAVRGDRAGAVDFLAKPLDAHLLRSKAAVLIELSRQRVLLSAQVEELRALQRTFEILIGALGHDLRNPLNAISLASETLVLARPDDEMATLIGARIRSAAQRMSRQISQILDFAALRSGSFPMQARDADLSQLCRTAASEFEELGKGGFDCGVQGDPRGCWDPERLVHMFSNLIGHALQHGGAGAAIAVRIDGRSPDALVVEVEGGGALPETARASLFDPLAPAGERKGGARLGLYLVDQIARAHGGSVSAEPCDGRTRFTVRLPRRAREP